MQLNNWHSIMTDIIHNIKMISFLNKNMLWFLFAERNKRINYAVFIKICHFFAYFKCQFGFCRCTIMFQKTPLNAATSLFNCVMVVICHISVDLFMDVFDFDKPDRIRWRLFRSNSTNTSNLYELQLCRIFRVRCNWNTILLLLLLSKNAQI